MIKVLVSGVGGDVAQGVIKCLNGSSLDIEIYKIAKDTSESWLYKDEKSFLSPPVNSPKYIPFLVQFLQDHGIDVFIPCIDAEIFTVSSHKDMIERVTRCKVCVGNIDRLSICEDKLKTFQFLKKNNFCYPFTFTNDSDIPYNFPYILKSRKGSGSKNIVTINNIKELQSNRFTEEDILQEKLNGDEYTAGIYLGKDKQVKGICIFKRKLKCGTTVFAERVIDDNLELQLSQIATTLGLPYVNIQFKIKDGYPCPFEFNGRFSGTTCFVSRVFNAPEMWIKEELFCEEILPVQNKEKFQVMRFYDEIYASEDDINRVIERSR